MSTITGTKKYQAVGICYKVQILLKRTPQSKFLASPPM